MHSCDSHISLSTFLWISFYLHDLLNELITISIPVIHTLLSVYYWAAVPNHSNIISNIVTHGALLWLSKIVFLSFHMKLLNVLTFVSVAECFMGLFT